MPQIYVVSKSPKSTKWNLDKEVGRSHTVFLGSYDTRKAAVVAGRLLAGWRNAVFVR